MQGLERDAGLGSRLWRISKLKKPDGTRDSRGLGPHNAPKSSPLV